MSLKQRKRTFEPRIKLNHNIDTDTVKNIWKSYIWTADKDMNESDPRSNVHYLGSSENKAWKNSGLYGIWTHDLCDTGAALYQLS